MIEAGIEKLGVYPGRHVLSIADLASTRGLSFADMERDLLTMERSVFPPWEDAVTLAVNAADPILSPDDRAAIGLLIASTETSVDQEKPLSSWIHHALDLPDDCRNFEIKHACAGATDAVQLARAWLAGPGRGRKALVVTSDRSLVALGEPWEPVNGGAGAAILLSDTPHVLRYDGFSALHTQHITDVIRPTPRLETGNSQESLYGYIEALDGALATYLGRCPAAREFDTHFQAHIYHTPFAGMAYRAHRAVLQSLRGSVSHAESRAHFERRVLPALAFNRRIGSSYGASTFIALTGLLHQTTLAAPGDRISIYSYGAGSCGEFYAGVIGDDPVPHVFGAALQRRLDARRRLAVGEYEAFERAADQSIGLRDISPDSLLPDDRPSCERLYRLTGLDEYVRHYEWSEP